MKIKKDKNNFRFWVPLTITKSKNEEGEEVMKIGGIASTADEDSDGEVLDPKGFNLKPLLSTGFLNWHHQQKSQASAIIGEPTKAEVKKEGLYIEGELYKDSELARQVYDLAQTLEKNSKTRRLGFSIEGKAIEKDPDDETKITRADITGCAITYMPKNPSTFLNIIKGESTGMEDMEYDVTEDESNGGVEYILDMTTKKGEKIRITKEGKIIMDMSKSLSAGSPSGQAITPSHVDHSMKVTADSSIVTSGFKKSEIYDKIFSDMPDIDILKAQQVYTIIHKIHEMKTENKAKKGQPTTEDIEKAYTLLGITKAKPAKKSEILKAEDEEDEKEKGEGEEKEKSVKKAAIKKTVKKGEEEEEEKEKAESEEEEEKEKAEGEEEEEEKEKAEGEEEEEEKKAVKKAIKKAKKAEDTEEEKEKAEGEEEEEKEKGEEDEKDMKKGQTSHYLKKGDHYERFINKGGELVKADSEVYEKAAGLGFRRISGEKKLEKAVTELIKGQKDTQLALGTVLGDILKGQKDFQESISERLAAIENGTPGRKSLEKAKVREKQFDKGEEAELEKAGKSGDKVIDIRKRGSVLAALEKAVYSPLEKGQPIDAGFEKAMTAYESTRSVSPQILLRLHKEHGYKIVGLKEQE